MLETFQGELIYMGNHPHRLSCDGIRKKGW